MSIIFKAITEPDEVVRAVKDGKDVKGIVNMFNWENAETITLDTILRQAIEVHKNITWLVMEEEKKEEPAQPNVFEYVGALAEKYLNGKEKIKVIPDEEVYEALATENAHSATESVQVEQEVAQNEPECDQNEQECDQSAEEAAEDPEEEPPIPEHIMKNLEAAQALDEGIRVGIDMEAPELTKAVSNLVEAYMEVINDDDNIPAPEPSPAEIMTTALFDDNKDGNLETEDTFPDEEKPVVEEKKEEPQRIQYKKPVIAASSRELAEKVEAEKAKSETKEKPATLEAKKEAPKKAPSVDISSFPVFDTNGTYRPLRKKKYLGDWAKFKGIALTNEQIDNIIIGMTQERYPNSVIAQVVRLSQPTVCNRRKRLMGVAE